MIKDYEITTNKNNMNVKAIHKYLTRAYWSNGISLENVQKAFENSFCFGVLKDNEQVGYARLVTDYASIAYLADVYILEEHRNKGISKWLINEIINHPNIKDVRKIILATKDAHTLYEKFDFKKLEKPQSYMEKILKHSF